jgi:hypothetical protein
MASAFTLICTYSDQKPGYDGYCSWYQDPPQAC